MPDGIIPLDLAVVNGDLVRQDILYVFHIHDGAPDARSTVTISRHVLGLTEEYIDEHISNNHLVFLNPALENEVKNGKSRGLPHHQGKTGGYPGLVTRPPSTLSNTSTVRNDSYPAGCEIILVESYTPVSCGN